MSVFSGQIIRGDEPPFRGTVQVEDGRVRLMTDRRRLASWDQKVVQCQRLSVFRFQLSDGDETYAFQPTDPAGFSQEIGAVVDLRATKTRFGLGERVRQATGR